jgi:ubiquinone/menaquinone biosynthesis C-methylase UbiE
VAAWARRVSADAGLRVGDAALDLGCGSGVFAQALASESGTTVLGLDLAPPASRGSESGVHWLLGAAQRLPFADRSLRLVFLSNLVHHLEDPLPVLREVRRCLAPGGSCMVRAVTPAQLKDRPQYRFFPTALEMAATGTPTASRLRNLLSGACFKPVAADTISQPSSIMLGELLDLALEGRLPQAQVESALDRRACVARLSAYVERRGRQARDEERYTLLQGRVP